MADTRLFEDAVSDSLTKLNEALSKARDAGYVVSFDGTAEPGRWNITGDITGRWEHDGPFPKLQLAWEHDGPYPL